MSDETKDMLGLVSKIISATAAGLTFVGAGFKMILKFNDLKETKEAKDNNNENAT